MSLDMQSSYDLICNSIITAVIFFGLFLVVCSDNDKFGY